MKKALIIGLKGLFAVAALGYLIYTIDSAALWAAFHEVDLIWIGVSLGLVPVIVGLDAAVWRKLLAPVIPEVTMPSVVCAVLSGSAWGVVTPARVGEFAGRAFHFPEADAWQVSATVFAQRVIDTAVCSVMGLGALLFALQAGWLPNTALWTTITLAVAGVSLVLALAVCFPGRTTRVIQWIAPQANQLHRRITFLEQIDGPSGRRILQLALLRQGIFCALFASLVAAFGPAAAPLDILVGILLVFLAKFLLPSVTLLDLGVREGAAVFFLGAVGVAPEAAFNAALLMFVLTGVVPALAGLPYAFRLPRTLSSVVSGSSA